MATGKKDNRKYRQRAAQRNPNSKATQEADARIIEAALGPQGEPMPWNDAIMGNPNYGSGDVRYRSNCQKCVWAYEARRRGYDVIAKPKLDGEDGRVNIMWEKEPLSFVNGGTEPLEMVTVFNPRDVSKNPSEFDVVESITANTPKGARGCIAVADSTKQVGHVFNWENEDGFIVQFYDAQTGTAVDMSALSRFDFIQWARMDDKKFSKTISYFVEQNRKREAR